MVREYINMDDVVAMLSLQADQRPKRRMLLSLSQSQVYIEDSRTSKQKACKLSDKFGRRFAAKLTQGQQLFSMTQTCCLGDFPPVALACKITHFSNLASIPILPHIYAPISLV